jgi:hypothetical protein
MNRNDTAANASRRLYGPTVQYADGTLVPGPAVDVEDVLTRFLSLEADERSSFLCIIAHDLTVAIRSIVYDAPVTEAGRERLKWINESLHQLTSCVNPHKRWSARDEALLVRDIIENSFEHGFDSWVGRALAVAAGSTSGTQDLPKANDTPHV